MNPERKDFLISMYNQMFNDINRHIMVVWQSIGVLIGAFTILALTEKNVISLDIAVSLIVLLCAWLAAHLVDASYWYNRNLVIIANIERLFLEADDLRKIQYYFGVHRPGNRMISHLKIQGYLGIGLTLVVLFYHASQRVFPGLSLSICNFEFARSIPYLFVAISSIIIYRINEDRDKSYQEFLKNSPGIDVDVSGVTYGVGHGHFK